MSARGILTGSLVAVALLLGPGPGIARVEQPIEPHMAGWEAIFEVAWEATEPKGQPVVSGYLINISPYNLTRIQVLLDTLDAAGAIVAQRVAWVGGGVLGHGRVYFEIPAPRPGPQYRVRVYSYDRLESESQGRSD